MENAIHFSDAREMAEAYGRVVHMAYNDEVGASRIDGLLVADYGEVSFSVVRIDGRLEIIL